MKKSLIFIILALSNLALNLKSSEMGSAPLADVDKYLKDVNYLTHEKALALSCYDQLDDGLKRSQPKHLQR